MIAVFVFLFAGPFLLAAFGNPDDCSDLFRQLRSGVPDVDQTSYERVMKLISSGLATDENLTKVIGSIETQNMGGEISQLDWMRLFSECTVLNNHTQTRMTIPVVLFERGFHSALVVMRDHRLLDADILFHASGDNGNNILHYVMLRKNLSLISFVVHILRTRFPVLLTTVNSEGVTPFALACKNYPAAISMLQTNYRLQAGASDPMKQITPLKCDQASAAASPQPAHQPPPVASLVVPHNTAAFQRPASFSAPMSAGVASAVRMPQQVGMMPQPLGMKSTGLSMQPQAYNPMMRGSMMGSVTQAPGSMFAPQVPTSFISNFRAR